tara:strand:- start:396 stop:848 length:453 start_codon:yes stop_codon:yes gene_type:complete
MKRQYVEIVGAVSIIASLVFVGVEIRQNTSAIRGATQQEISSQISDMLAITAENERIAYLVDKAFSGATKSELNRVDYSRFRAFATIGLRRIENIYLQHMNGFLSNEAFERIGWDYYRSPLLREIWKERKGGFNPEFVLFYEKLRDKEIK